MGIRFPAGDWNRYQPARMVLSQIGDEMAPKDKWWLALRSGSSAMTIWLPSWQGSSCSSIKDGSVVVVVVVVDLKIIRLLLVQKFAEIQKNCAVVENNRKSLIQHCERSELRLHFEWPKVHQKSQKRSILASFWQTWSLHSNSVTRQVNYIPTKIDRKCQNWKIQMRHFG